MSEQQGDKCPSCGNWNSKHVTRCTFCNVELPPLQPSTYAVIQPGEKQSGRNKPIRILDNTKETVMSEQPGKSRTIKTVPQGSPPSVLQVQYTAIIQHLVNIEQQLDFLIAQPQQAKPKTETTAIAGEQLEEKPERSIGIWEQTERERAELNKEKPIIKKKSGKGKFFVVILVVIILVALYLFWSYSHGYVPIWMRK